MARAVLPLLLIRAVSHLNRGYSAFPSWAVPV